MDVSKHFQRSIFLVLFFTSLQALPLLVQAQRGVFDPATIRNYNHLNGLPQNSVNDFCFDNLGYMWIATWDGLSRFDGQHFKNNFGYNSSIPLKAKVVQFFKKNADTIYALTTEQKIFVITFGKVVSYENYSVKKHGVLLRYSQVSVPFPKNTSDSNFVSYNTKNNPDIQYAFPGFKYQKDSFGILGNNLMIYTGRGLVKTLPLPVNDFTVAHHHDPKVNLLGSRLVMLNYKTNSLDLFSVTGTVIHLPLPLRNNNTWKIYNSPDNNSLFLSNSNNLFEVTGNGEDGQTVFTKMLGNFQDSVHIQLIYNLDNKFLLIATQSDGLYVLHKNVVQTFQAPVKMPGVNNFYAQALLPDDKTILTGINFLFDKKGFKGIAEGVIKGEQPSYTDAVNISLLNRIIFKSSDNFYWYMRKEYDSFFLMKALYPGATKAIRIAAIIKEPIYNIFEDSKGNTWFNNNGELGYLDKKSDKYVTLLQDTGKNYLATQTIRCYVEDSDGRILVGTTNGLFICDYLHGYTKPKRYLLEGVVIHYLSFNKETGALWIGTYGKGLWILKKSGELIQVPVDKENNRSTIHYTITDQYNRVWLSSNEGLYVTTKKALNDFETNPSESPYFYKFSVYNGFAEDEFNAGCQLPMILQRDGSLTVSSVGGLAWLNTNDVPFDFYGKKMATLITHGSKTEQEDIRSLDIEADDNTELIIDVMAPDWGPGYNIQLEYKIIKQWENINRNWQHVNEQHQISFPLLSAGDYEIVIRKRTGLNDNDFIYHSVKIHKKRFWYQTVFLYPILIILLVIIGYLGYLWRVVTLKQKNKRLQKKISVATADLQNKNEELLKTVQTRDSLILLFNHDLSTPLFYINRMAQTFAEEDKEKGVYGGMVQLLADSTQDLEELMNDMLLWIQIQQKNSVIQIVKEPVNINELLEKTFSIFSHRLSYNMINVKLQIPDDTIINTDRRVFNSILYNIVTNAIKYTRNGVIKVENANDIFENGHLSLIVRSKSNTDVLQDWKPGLNYNAITNLIKGMPLNRSNEQSHQIGLQLVQNFSKLLELNVVYENSDEDIFTIIISGLNSDGNNSSQPTP